MEKGNFEWFVDPHVVKHMAIGSIIKLGEIVDLLEKKNPELPIIKSEYCVLVKRLQPMIDYVINGLIGRK